ncbi:sodium-translocating pyrophosphatase [candidate division KSB1 bacterium]|nr:MAG: sodium-translocating pyrophosphatase [candidate division KSB1 bacterium]
MNPLNKGTVNRKAKTWLLGLLVVALAIFICAGPSLFAQPSAAQPASAPSGEHGGGEAIQLPFGEEAWIPLFIVLAGAIIALGFGVYWWRKTMKQDPGSERMQGVARAVQEGAMAYLAKQVKTMTPVVIVLGVGLFFLYRNQYAFMGDETALILGLGVSIAFLLGVTASYLAGYVGMGVAVRGNVRVANAALSSFKKALEIAFQAGAVSGMFTVGLGLLGATITFMIFQQNAMFVLVGFGFGGSLAALFMRVGGGIFTKAADVGADLVGKVEAGIPEDDPRNAATIADNVGDNVGDCAGMAADVFESYEVTLVAAIILAAAVGFTLQSSGFGEMTGNTFTAAFTLKLVIYALLVRAVGVVASIIGVFAVRGKDDPNMNPMKPINVGFFTSAFFASLGFLIVSWWVFKTGYMPAIPPEADRKLIGLIENFWWLAFLANFFGIVLTQIIGKITEYFTAVDKKPVTEIASSAKTGPATLILSGLSEGLESSVWGIVAIAATIYGAFILFPDPAFAAYAIALAGLGLLATTGYVLAMDTYGPISDNANGIFEMSGALKNADGSENKAAHNIVSRLDMVGNTTKALTKGFAIATAVIAAVSLYRSFLDTVAVRDAEILVKNIQVNLPDVFIGLLIGGAVPFLFSSFAIRAVSRAAVLLVEEVRRQFRTIPGIWEYTGVGEKGKPDYARCVAISTAAAQKELLSPGLLAVFSPILIGFWLGPYSLGGFLAGAILVGQLMAVFMSNTGGAWDNAKKKIEDGFLGGKGSEAHKAGVIGDTVGDPLKDTAGPALNPMIKVMNLVAILIAPSTVVMRGSAGGWVMAFIALAILTGAILFSKRGGVETSTESSQAVAKH